MNKNYQNDQIDQNDQNDRNYQIDQNDQIDQIDLNNQKEQKMNKNEPICVNIGEIWKRPNKIPNNFQTCRTVRLHSRSKKHFPKYLDILEPKQKLSSTFL